MCFFIRIDFPIHNKCDLAGYVEMEREAGTIKMPQFTIIPPTDFDGLFLS